MGNAAEEATGTGRKSGGSKVATGSKSGGSKSASKGGSPVAGLEAAKAHLSGGGNQTGGTGKQGGGEGKPSKQGGGEGGSANQGETTAARAVVQIEIAEIPGRGGRPKAEEKYPFRKLAPSVEEDGLIKGPSFLIPASEKAIPILAAARKRNKGINFISRKVDGGTRVWRAPD